MTCSPETIDEYLATLSADKRSVLERIRKTIKSVASYAEERICYKLSAFRLNGRMLVAFGAAANHCALYPMSSSTVETFKDDLKSYNTSKGTIRFKVPASSHPITNPYKTPPHPKT